MILAKARRDDARQKRDDVRLNSVRYQPQTVTEATTIGAGPHVQEGL